MPVGPLTRIPPTPFRPTDTVNALLRGGAFGAPLVQTTIRYVRKTGSDSNGGTSPADAWLTVNKALTTVSPGTVIYVGAGTYRETVSVSVTPTPGLPVSLIGDVDGFRTGDAGAVIVTAYTTNDKNAPSATTLLNTNGKSNLTFQGILFIAGTGNPSLFVLSNSINLTFTACAFTGTKGVNVSTISCTPTLPGPLNHLFDSCFFNLRAGPVYNPPTQNGADYDAQVTIQNSVLLTLGVALDVTAGGALTGKPGGIRVKNCSLISGTPAIRTNNANSSTAVPLEVRGCIIEATTNCLNANASGQIVESNNLLYGSTPRVNVAVGQGSVSDNSYAPLYHIGQERIWGGMLRPFMEPMAGSPLLNFGAADSSAGLLDLLQRPRPSTPTRFAVGALQRGNNFGSSTLAEDGDNLSIAVTGDGSEDFDIPVNAGALTLSIYCQYDSDYIGPAPRFAVLANGELSVSYTETYFDKNAQAAWQQRSITIYPTAAGILTVRVIAGDTSGVSVTNFDAFAAA